MPVDPNNLPQDPAILKQMLVDLTAQLDKTQRLLRQLLAARSGTRSEQLSADQLRLFAEELGIDSSAGQESDKDDASSDHPASGSNGNGDEGKRRGRRQLPSHLRRERIVHDLTEEQKNCEACRQQLRHIGEEVSERYEYVPAQMLVIEDACPEVRLRMHGENSNEAGAAD